VVLAVAVGAAWLGWRWPSRIAAYCAFLLLAGLSESHLLLRLGSPEPWTEMLRGWAAGAAVALLADALLSLTRCRGCGAAVAAAAALAILLALPPLRRAYEEAVSEPLPPAPASQKPDVLLMTALPLIWGEGGAFDPNSRPAALYTALQREFLLRPIDALDEPSLAMAPMLLLIQPRWLAPAELVALDAWMRRGGRALILTDPRLGWHSDLPLGDIRRPPATGLLKPLLSHWGLTMEPGAKWSDGAFPRGRRLVMEHPGRLVATGPACRVTHPSLAQCSVGRGSAIILADADLARDELWVGNGEGGASRHRRLSDNPLVLADLLDRLAGVERPRALGDAHWRAPGTSLPHALLWTLLPLAGLGLAAGLAAPLLRRRRAR
jgi:hypothetical protein